MRAVRESMRRRTMRHKGCGASAICHEYVCRVVGSGGSGD
jgi:hypothetical protein